MAAATVLVLSVVAAGCTSGSSDGGSGSSGGDEAAVTIEAHGGTDQVWLTSEPDVELQIQDADGDVVTSQTVDAKAAVHDVDSRTTDDEGALVFRYVEPGKDYVVKQVNGPGTSEPFDVTSTTDHPDQAFYDEQEIDEGYGYLTTRDGTKLAINVTLPGPVEDGPYPTVIEYSGYDPANPEPSLVTISKTLAGGQGFATVGVNIRGSGCSGGSFQLWEDAQALDGYDAVEAVAAQPWVQGNKVGMVGHLVPGHRDALRRRHQPAQPRGPRADGGLRRRLPRPAVAGRHPEQGLRPVVGRGALQGGRAGQRRVGRRSRSPTATRPARRTCACAARTSTWRR